MSGRFRHVAGGTVVSLALFAVVIVLSQWPQWQNLPPDAGIVRLSLRHSGQRDCRPATEAELAALPPNMRRREICDRRRPPIRVRMDVDGATVFDREVPPSGLWGTGPSRVYERFVLPAGRHAVEVMMADDPASDDFRFSLSREIELAAGQNLAVDFDPSQGGFVIFE